MGKGSKKKRSKKRPVPLAPPPAMKSRKKARITTTLFHKFTKERDEARIRGDDKATAEAEKAIEEMGGREAYQQASQLNTSIFSTSRWALGVLGSKGWLQGISDPTNSEDNNTQSDASGDERRVSCEKKKRKRIPKRHVRLLEVGAINRELLDAAAKTRRKKKKKNSGETNSEEVEEPVYRLNVRAIDLRSTQEGIEEADFLKLPLCDPDPCKRYDTIVCSMVINCVTTPEDRGLMLALLFHQLRPGGLLLLTLPRLCLSQSRYMTQALFSSMLSEGVGFLVEKQRKSPKVQFYVLQRPEISDRTGHHRRLGSKYTKKQVMNKGKKYRNEFACVLNEDTVNGVLEYW